MTQYTVGDKVNKRFDRNGLEIGVGSTVRRVVGQWMGMEVGDVSEVTAVDAYGTVRLRSFDGAHDAQFLVVCEDLAEYPKLNDSDPDIEESAPVCSFAAVPVLNDGARFPSSLPNGSAERKEYPLQSVLFGYFPAAMNALAHHAWKSNAKHNPGKPLQWSRNNSSDHGDCLMRHMQEGDYEGVLWRAAALLQLKLEEEGAPVAPLATFD